MRNLQDLSRLIETDGFVVFDTDPRVAEWADAAHDAMGPILADKHVRDQNLRHGKTWFVGVDILPNDQDGAIANVPLAGPWQPLVPALPQHNAQVSIVYPGYPKKDQLESEANHSYRLKRSAAHVDGLLPVGDTRRRFALEYHAYILGLPLNPVTASPTVVWRGSHRIMQEALAGTIGNAPIGEVDLTEVYHAARREVFDRCECMPIFVAPGQSYLIHRFALHGTAPWSRPDGPGRMVAFLRPEFPNPVDWLMPG